MKILVTEPYSAKALARLQSNGHTFVSDQEATAAEVALVRSRTTVDAEFLARHPQLKLVVSATSGIDHIDAKAVADRGVTATHTPEANAAAAAELTIGLLIAAERRLLAAVKNVRNNQWREHLKRPRGLEGHTLGIVGLGRIGQRVARIAQLLEMKVVAYDPYIEPEAFGTVTRRGFIELLRESDYVSLHVPLTRETRHLLNLPTFREMNPEALLINTCRGPVVDENDLMTALDDGLIAGAAMDVIEREPPPRGHRVLTHPKLLLTPHIGAYTDAAWERASLAAADKVIQFAQGLPLADRLTTL